MTVTMAVDQASASVQISADDLRVWGSDQRVFVSSLIDDMRYERAAAREAVEGVGATPVMFEQDLGGQDVDAQQAYLAGVQSSSIYVGILGPRYGVQMADGYEATEAEFRRAQELGHRLILLVGGTSGTPADGRQQDFIGGLRNVLTTAPWTSATDVRAVVERRLREIAAEDLAPWVRLGDVLMRASTIIIDGNDTVTIVTAVKDRSVATHLERWREQPETIRVAHGDLAYNARIASVHSTTRNSPTPTAAHP